MNDHELAMLQAINAARAERGVHALTADEQLAAAAERHAQDIAQHPGLFHEGSDGSTTLSRVRDTGYAFEWVFEVVGWGWAGDIPPMVEWWLNSPAHVGLVLSGDVTEIGVGYATGLPPWYYYWAVVMARPVVVAPPPPEPPRPYTSYVPVVVKGEQ